MHSRTGEAVDKSGCTIEDADQDEILEVERCDCNAEPSTPSPDAEVVEGYGNKGYGNEGYGAPGMF